MTWLLALALLQGPGKAWSRQPSPPREVKRVYWEVFETTEVWLLLLPEGPQGEAARVYVVFQAFFPGGAKRDPYSGNPQWPKGKPERLVVRVEPFPMTVVRELSLQLVIGDETFDLGASCVSPVGSAPPCQLLLPCTERCAANGMSVEVQPGLLKALSEAGVATGTALGLPIVFSSDDLEAVRKFASAMRLTFVPPE